MFLGSVKLSPKLIVYGKMKIEYHELYRINGQVIKLSQTNNMYDDNGLDLPCRTTDVCHLLASFMSNPYKSSKLLWRRKRFSYVLFRQMVNRRKFLTKRKSLQRLPLCTELIMNFSNMYKA